MVSTLAKCRLLVCPPAQNEHDLGLELGILGEFILNNFHNLTLGEVKYAFDLALRGEYGSDFDTRCFHNSFNPQYVSKILNAYIDHKKGVMSELLRRAEDKKIREEMYRVPTANEKMQSMLELIEHVHAQWKLNGYIEDHFNVIYNYFWRSGINRPSNAEKKQAFEESSLKYNEIITRFYENALQSEIPNQKTLKTRIAKNICVSKYFETVDIRSILDQVSINHFQNA